MTVLNTGISWTHSTLNPSRGCTKVSAGCDHCYAERMTNFFHGGGFDQVKIFPRRLAELAKLGPIKGADGLLSPRLTFINSMSDLMHRDITDAFRHQCLDAFEQHPGTVCQILTKRPLTLRRFIAERYRGRGVPANIWLGVSVEDDRVASRIDSLRGLKDDVGDFTAFLSVEPLIGDCAKHDYRAIDQVLIGGESGPNSRDMLLDWPRRARDLARAVAAAIWFKQFGLWRNNPLYTASRARLHIDRVRDAIAAGEQEAAIEIDPKTGKERITGEKGGATLDGEVLHELPASYAAITAQLRAGAGMFAAA